MSAKFVDYRGKTIGTLLGSVRYERAYYHGCGCSGGWAPTDEELRLQDGVTPGAAEVAALHGLLEPFDEAAAKTLPKSAGLRLSAATVRRITEPLRRGGASDPGAGRDLRRRAGLGPAH